MQKVTWTPEVILAAKAAAVAMARFWDEMSLIECETLIEFDGTTAAVETLASLCGSTVCGTPEIADSVVIEVLDNMERENEEAL